MKLFIVLSLLIVCNAFSLDLGIHKLVDITSDVVRSVPTLHFGTHDEPHLGVQSRELDVSDLEYYVTTEEGKATLEKEFEGVRGGQRRPWTVASLPENLKKNRYPELLAFDDSRVVLNLLPGDPHSDYINANYINGYNSHKEYVATQGPLANTINDFWRMIWQLKATKIVMLANIMEHGKKKVEKYWPEDTVTYGNITVTKLAEVNSMSHLHHVIRVFQLNKPGHLPRIVRHFHYVAWPDLGVPDDRMSVVSLLQEARKHTSEGDNAPIVVHCSAGVGRTGTVILLDSALQRASAEGRVNFPRRLDEMRRQRVDVVEKKEQYIFAHAVLNDIFNGDGKQQLRRIAEDYRHVNMYLDEFNIPSGREKIMEKLKKHGKIMNALVQALDNGEYRL